MATVNSLTDCTTLEAVYTGPDNILGETSIMEPAHMPFAIEEIRNGFLVTLQKTPYEVAEKVFCKDQASVGKLLITEAAKDKITSQPTQTPDAYSAGSTGETIL